MLVSLQQALQALEVNSIIQRVDPIRGFIKSLNKYAKRLPYLANTQKEAL